MQAIDSQNVAQRRAVFVVGPILHLTVERIEFRVKEGRRRIVLGVTKGRRNRYQRHRRIAIRSTPIPNTRVEKNDDSETV
jgi:hypothetical protein